MRLRTTLRSCDLLLLCDVTMHYCFGFHGSVAATPMHSLYVMLKSHYSPVDPRMTPYDKLQCTGIYVRVREEYLSSTWAIRELYVVLRKSFHTGVEFLKCSKNMPYRPVQIILLSYSSTIIWADMIREVYGEVTWSVRKSYIMNLYSALDYYVNTLSYMYGTNTGLYRSVVWLQH